CHDPRCADPDPTATPRRTSAGTHPGSAEPTPPPGHAHRCSGPDPGTRCRHRSTRTRGPRRPSTGPRPRTTTTSTDSPSWPGRRKSAAAPSAGYGAPTDPAHATPRGSARQPRAVEPGAQAPDTASITLERAAATTSGTDLYTARAACEDLSRSNTSSVSASQSVGVSRTGNKPQNSFPQANTMIFKFT